MSHASVFSTASLPKTRVYMHVHFLVELQRILCVSLMHNVVGRTFHTFLKFGEFVLRVTSV